MPNYIDYIRQHIMEHGASRQDPFSIEQLYDLGKLRTISNVFFQRYVDELTGVPLTREYVRSCFPQNYYKGFVATMLWGGLGKTSWTHLKQAMMVDKPEVELRIGRIQDLLHQGRLEDSFQSLQGRGPEDFKFPGIDISYFTKLLYFLSPKDKYFQPLIYDKWGRFIHAGILISEERIDDFHLFYKIGLGRNGAVWIDNRSNLRTHYRYSTYVDYLREMADLSQELDLPNPGVLEEILFGKPLIGRGNLNDNNPRFFVRNYVQHFAEN